MLKKLFVCAIIWVQQKPFFEAIMKSNSLSVFIRRVLSFLYLPRLGLLIGILCGLIGAAFSHAVKLAALLFSSHGWILYLLPLGGIASVLIYRLFNVTHLGTDDAVESAHSDKKISAKLTPAVFICTVISHLFGASAGREGAALKMGGGIAALFSNRLHLSERDRRSLALCGMSGVFAAVFGSPVGAAVFSVEVVRSAYIKPRAIISSFVSSICAFSISILLGVHPERFHISEIPSPALFPFVSVLLIGALCGIISLAFCYTMHYAPVFAKNAFKNDILRISVLSALIVIITVIVGNRDYNGGGMQIIEGIFEGEMPQDVAFLLKILFTAITVAAGFKGGEIVPGFFVGACAGSLFASLLGIPPSFGAAIGMVSLFAGITNCPIATIVLGIEMFGAGAVHYFIIAVTVSFLLSGRLSLYDKDKYPFKRLKAEFSQKKL